MRKKIVITAVLFAFFMFFSMTGQALESNISSLAEAMSMGLETQAIPENISVFEAALEAAAAPAGNPAEDEVVQISAFEAALQAASEPIGNDPATSVQGEPLDTPFTYTSSGFGTYSGKESLSAEADGPFEDFDGLYLGGAALNQKDYKVESGKGGETIIILSSEFLKTLPKGEYTFAAKFKGGFSSNLKLYVSGSGALGEEDGVYDGFPKTGDDLSVGFWLITMIVSSAICVIAEKRKRVRG